MYEFLRERETHDIAEHTAGGNVGGSKTGAQDVFGSSCLCTKPSTPPSQHYQLVGWMMGSALWQFGCTKQLVTAVLDALKAYSHTFNVTKRLHHNISAANIMLTMEGRGLLIDWDLTERANDVGSGWPNHMGTWHFVSANLLRKPGKVPTLADELESFLHLLGWMVLRYIPADGSYDSIDRHRDMFMFHERYLHKREAGEGGDRKYTVLGAEYYSSRRCRPRTPTPLSALLAEINQPFKTLYGTRKPTTEDRRKVDIDAPPSLSDRELVRSYVAICTYDEGMQRLAPSTWLIEAMSKALEEKEWPTLLFLIFYPRAD